MKPVKILLLVVTGAAVLCSGIGTLFWLQWRKSEALLVERGQEVTEAGTAFARNATQAGCVDEALGRLDDCSGLHCEVESRLFLSACLRAAEPVDGFCTRVAAPTDVLTVSAWARERCAGRDREDDPRCGRLMQEVQELCQQTGD